MGLRRLWRYFAKECTCGGECGAIFWGELFPKSLHPYQHGSGSWGWAVFALHCQVLIGTVCPVLPRWHLLLGQVSEHCCKAVGVLL